MTSLTERYADKILGVLSCYDRVVITGTLLPWGTAKGMTAYLYSQGIRIFDYEEFAKPFNGALTENAKRLAEEHGLEIEFIRKVKTFRKEDRIKEVLAKRGQHPGLVHIFSAMETCSSYKPWHDKQTHKTFLKPDIGKCLHYYFYFIDPDLGLCFLRVPTWCPFRLLFYYNGHNQLAAELSRRGISYQLVDNAFVDIGDFAAAQKLADEVKVQALHKALDHYARVCCPLVEQMELSCHWSLHQVEYSTDIVFRRPEDLREIYDALTRTAIHAVKADDVAMFLGRKLNGNYQGELGTDFNTRIEGTRIRHHMGPASVKMYDKFARILRIETTTYDVTFFKHHRKVVQKDGQIRFKVAPLKKTIYSITPDLRGLLLAANQRYLAFISALDDPTDGARTLVKIAEPVREDGRPYRGFNLFDGSDYSLFLVLTRGEFNISGFRNRDLRERTDGSNTASISRCLKRLRLHGLVKLVPGTFKYYLTELGRRVITAALAVKEMLIPKLARPAAT